MKKVASCLWFDGNAEDALDFYLATFKDARPGAIVRTAGDEQGGEGSLLTATFTVHGHEFMLLNGGPEFTFSEAVSFIVYGDSQEEIDWYWKRLSKGGVPGQCGWLKDQFGVSWQVVPSVLGTMLRSTNQKKVNAVLAALMKMTKLDIRKLQQSFSSVK